MPGPAARGAAATLLLFGGMVLGGAAALAGPRPLPTAWPDEVVTAFPEAQAARGATGDAVEPACSQAAPGLQLCVVIEEEGRRRLASLADVGRWGGLTGALAHARAAADGAAAGFVDAVVPDLPGASYRIRSQGDGLDTALLARPDLLAAVATGPVVVAVPDAGTTLVWTPGNADQDKVLAVAVRKAWDASTRPVSPRIYRWNGEAWTTWGEAKPAAPPAP